MPPSTQAPSPPTGCLIASQPRMSPKGNGGGAPAVKSLDLPKMKLGEPRVPVKDSVDSGRSSGTPGKPTMARRKSSGFVSITVLGKGRNSGLGDRTLEGSTETGQRGRGRANTSPLGPAPSFPKRPASSGDSSANSSRSQSKSNSPRISRMTAGLMQRLPAESVSPRSDSGLNSPKSPKGVSPIVLSAMNFSPRRDRVDDDRDGEAEGSDALKAVMARRASVQEEERMTMMLKDLIKGTQAMSRGDNAIPSLKKNKYLRKESSSTLKERVPFSIREALSGKRHAHKDTVDPEKIGTGLTHTDTVARHRSPLKAARIMAENINHKAKTKALFSSNPSGEPLKNEAFLQDIFVKKPMRHDVTSVAPSDMSHPRKRRASISYAGTNEEWEDADKFEHEWFPYTIFTTTLESNVVDREMLRASITRDELVTESFEKLMYKDHNSAHQNVSTGNMLHGSKGESMNEPFLRRGVPIPHSETYHSTLTPSLAGRGSIPKDKAQPSAPPNQTSAVEETLDYRKFQAQGDKTVHEISLPGNNLKDHGVRLLVREIKKKTRLHTATKLDLSLNSIHDEGAMEIAQGLRDLNLLKVLNVSNNCIGPRGTLSIARSCHKVASLGHVDFSSNFIGPDGAEALSVMISNPNITWMDISNNEIGDRGAIHFGVALKNNKTLQVFHMSTCDIRHDGAHALAEALKTNTSLRELYLTGNMIKVSGAASLASMLMQNNTIKTLIIRWTNIENQGARYISAALEHNIGLEILDISNNQLTAATVDGFSNTLRYHNRTLKFLDLSKTTFKNDLETCRKLRNAIWADTGLVTLKLSEGDMDPKLHKECLKVLAAREELREQNDEHLKATTKPHTQAMWRPSSLNARESVELMALVDKVK